MMTCEDFETLMADALGNELSETDRPAFEAHLAECEKCRREYETASKTVVTMRQLPGPERITFRREGDRLIIDEKRAAGFGPRRGPDELTRATRRWGGVFRYAASILIAFTAGYALHAGLILSDARRPAPQSEEEIPGLIRVGPSAGNLQQAFVNAHVRKPARSDLAKCLIAMAKPRD